MMRTQTKSALFSGWLRHRRTHPRRHSFASRLSMFYINLDDWDSLGAHSPLLNRRFSPMKIARTDYFDGGDGPLKPAVQSEVRDKLGIEADGPICLLTQPRYFGNLMNPINIYYCFTPRHELAAVVLEVTNTPWGDRVRYCLPASPGKNGQRISFAKQMHVSPFHDMNLDYQWNGTAPADRVFAHILCTERDGGKMIFDAGFLLTAAELNTKGLLATLLKTPLMSVGTRLTIYWQALLLYCKGLRVYKHPAKTEQKEKST